MNDIVRVTESDHAIKFSALYMARELGYFAAEKLAVAWDVDAGPGGSWLVDNLIAGKADIAVGGIWLPLMYRQLGLGDFRPFAALCHRNPSIVLGRAPLAKPFQWEILYGKRVLLPMAATSQWMFLEGTLKRADIEMERIKFVRDLDAGTIRALWAAGFGDFLLSEPLAGEALADSGFPIAFTLADAAGPVPWSILYAKAEIFGRADRLGERFFAAVDRAARWLVESEETRVTRALERLFPAALPRHVENVVRRLKATGVWTASSAIDATAADQYQDIMIRHGLLSRREVVALAGSWAPSSNGVPSPSPPTAS
jgi:NitT/TauT family transport system substrate-binding protein